MIIKSSLYLSHMIFIQSSTSPSPSMHSSTLLISSMNTKLILAAVLIAATSISFSIFLVDVDNSSGSPRGGRRTTELELLPLIDGAVGPESITFDAGGGGPYTGVSDGRILQWRGKGLGWIEYGAVHNSSERLEMCRGSKDPRMEHLCGRPLGLHFGKSGELYIADAYFGLLMKGANEKYATPIATQAQGTPFRFTNSLDRNKETGAIYFTDSSKTFHRREFMAAVVSGDKTGRVMRYDPHSKEVHVLLDGLSFPNGVALSEDGSFLLIAETTTCRLLRYWLKTPKATTLEVFAQLPGFPDNISKSPRGGFWVALHPKRGKLIEWFLSLPVWLKELVIKTNIDLQKMSSLLNIRWRRAAVALRLNEEGDEVLEVLEGFRGEKMKYISEVRERNGSLWIGSFLMPHVVLYKP